MGRSATLRKKRKKQREFSQLKMNDFVQAWQRIQDRDSLRIEQATKYVREHYPDLMSSVNELQTLSAEETKLTPSFYQEDWWLWPDRRPFHNADGTPKTIVTSIARKLFRVGGHSAMVAALRCVPAVDQRSLDVAFCGIGEWRL